MSETRPFTIRSNTAARVLGAIVVASHGGSLALFVLFDRHPERGWARGLFPSILWVPPGVWLALRVSRIDVDPLAGRFVRRTGVWPFVKIEPRAFSEVEDVVEDTVRHRRGRARIEKEYNRLRLVFAGGEAWDVLEEFHTGTRVRITGERLAALTGQPLTSG